LAGSRIASRKAAGNCGSALMYQRKMWVSSRSFMPLELLEDFIGQRLVEVIGHGESTGA
jgi:hypothetical protein